MALTAAMLAAHAQADSPRMIGWVEHVGIQPGGLIMNAKIDTGADHSSVHAEDVQIASHDGVRVVSFTLRNRQGQSIHLQKPLVRYTLIKRRRNSEPLRRPVVAMDLCVGGSLKRVNVNLANRENFKYRMLIGRSYLKQSYAVDPNLQHTLEPACRGQTVASNSAR
jgi:hypothetical protein